MERLKLKIGLLSPLTDGDVILLMNGVDHVAPQRSFPHNLRLAQEKMPGFSFATAAWRTTCAPCGRKGSPFRRSKESFARAFAHTCSAGPSPRGCT